MRIDSHQHFWVYEPREYPWIKPGSVIQRDFLPRDLEPLLKGAGLQKCVAVQARQTLAETRWLLELAEHHSIIAGVVGWVDLRHDRVREQLEEFSGHPRFVGVRHVVQDESDDFMLGAAFQRGIGALRDFRLAYDLLIYPRQLDAAIQLVRRFPEQRFVLDHMAKPNIRERQLEPWAGQIRELARAENVSCKISGLVTEAEWNRWQPEHFRPFLDVVWEAFGEDRLMVGSDWPVCTLSGGYGEVMGLAGDYLQPFSEGTREKVLGGNAARFYLLEK